MESYSAITDNSFYLLVLYIICLELESIGKDRNNLFFTAIHTDGPRHTKRRKTHILLIRGRIPTLFWDRFSFCKEDPLQFSK